jgi:hypothetical protein
MERAEALVGWRAQSEEAALRWTTMRAVLESFYVRAELWAYAHLWVFSLVVGAFVGSLPLIDPEPHGTFGSRAHSAIFILVGVTLITRLMSYVRAGARRSRNGDR